MHHASSRLVETHEVVFTVQHPMLTMVILSLDSAKVSVLVQKHPKTSVLGAPRNNLIEGALGGPQIYQSLRTTAARTQRGSQLLHVETTYCLNARLIEFGLRVEGFQPIMSWQCAGGLSEGFSAHRQCRL